MINSQESDSIAEKPEVVQTEPKSNRWNWREETALVTAPVIATSGIFYYQQIANDALAASAAAEGGKWFVKYFTGYTIGRALHATQAKQIQYSLTAEVDE